MNFSLSWERGRFPSHRSHGRGVAYLRRGPVRNAAAVPSSPTSISQVRQMRSGLVAQELVLPMRVSEQRTSKRVLRELTIWSRNQPGSSPGTGMAASCNPTNLRRPRHGRRCPDDDNTWACISEQRPVVCSRVHRDGHTIRYGRRLHSACGDVRASHTKGVRQSLTCICFSSRSSRRTGESSSTLPRRTSHAAVQPALPHHFTDYHTPLAWPSDTPSPLDTQVRAVRDQLDVCAQLQVPSLSRVFGRGGVRSTAPGSRLD